MPVLAAGVLSAGLKCCTGIHVNGITSEGLYECFRCSIYGAWGWVFELVARTDGLISLLVWRCVHWEESWLHNRADSSRNVLKTCINMVFWHVRNVCKQVMETGFQGFLSMQWKRDKGTERQGERRTVSSGEVAFCLSPSLLVLLQK